MCCALVTLRRDQGTTNKYNSSTLAYFSFAIQQEWGDKNKTFLFTPKGQENELVWKGQSVKGGQGIHNLQVTGPNTIFQEHEALGLKKCSCYGHHQEAQIHSKTHDFNLMSKFGVTPSTRSLDSWPHTTEQCFQGVLRKLGTNSSDQGNAPSC